MHSIVEPLSGLAAFAAIVVLAWAPWLAAAFARLWLAERMGEDHPEPLRIVRSPDAVAVAVIVGCYLAYAAIGGLFPAIPGWLMSGAP